MPIESAFDARGAADDPGIGKRALGSNFQQATGINRPRRVRGDIHLDQLDRSIATRADRALRLLGYLMGSPTFQTMDRLAGIQFFSGKGRKFRDSRRAHTFSGGQIMGSAGAAVCGYEVGRLKLHETADRTPEW